MSGIPTVSGVFTCVNCGRPFIVRDDEIEDFKQFLLWQPPTCDDCYEAGMNAIEAINTEASAPQAGGE